MTRNFAGRRILLASSLAFFFPLFSAAQVPTVNPSPSEKDGIVGPQLIAWSALQKPEPVPQKPQPIPGPDQAQPSSQDRQQPSQADQAAKTDTPQTEPETQQTTSQSVSGTITKINNKYVLQTDDSVTYELDNQPSVAQYVGKHVKVTGTLNRSTGIIRVRSIELLS
jgi:hypothetical protein